MPSVLGRRDGSIRASRKRRSRNETDNWPLSKPGWATAATAAAATTEEFSQGIQAPSSMHPVISYPVKASPSLRYIYMWAGNELRKITGPRSQNRWSESAGSMAKLQAARIKLRSTWSASWLSKQAESWLANHPTGLVPHQWPNHQPAGQLASWFAGAWPSQFWDHRAFAEF